MTTPTRYTAYWVPGLSHEIGMDVSLTAGLTWLTEAERRCGTRGLVVMYAKKMALNNRILRQAALRWEFISPRSTLAFDGGPVLCIWPPNPSVLELAEQLALDAEMCVIAGKYDISGWVLKSKAVCLVDGFQHEIEDISLPRSVVSELDRMLRFGGHNGFLGAGEKEDAISALRSLAARIDPPSVEEVERYLMASGETDAAGVARAANWYSEVLSGRRHRDGRGRIIE